MKKIHLPFRFFNAFLLTFFLTSNTYSQVVINEILPDGTVELKNLGTETVDVSSYWLCDFPAYEKIEDLNIICGNMMLEGGGILTVDNFNFVAGDDGEMGLYTSSSFSSADAIIDYVEWGASGHQRSSLADAAGIWTAGDFVPAFGATQSLSYSGEGDGVDSWNAGNSTICKENVGSSISVVINEILADGTVEIKNVGTTTVNVSEFILCDFPAYEKIEDLNVICGNMMLGAGEILAVDNFNFVESNDGEMGLYAMGGFSNPDAIIDYVEWGASGHQRSSVADAAGIWTAGDFVPAFDATQSLAYSGTGDSSTDWTAGNATICAENTSTPTCDANGGLISLADGSLATTICVDGVADPMDVIFTTDPIGTNSGWVITDLNNNILALPTAPPFDLDGAGIGICLIWHIAYESDFGGNIVGNNVSDLTGCYKLSNSISVNREAADGGQVSLVTGGTTYTGTVGSIVFDVQHTTASSNLNYSYVITDNNDNILEWQTSGSFDLSGAPVGECHVWGWSNLGSLDPVAGEPIISLSDGDCEAISENWITVIREDIPVGGDASYEAILSGTQQTNTAMTRATGNVQAELTGNVLTISGSFSGLVGEFAADIGGGAHIHKGIAGRNGGVELALTTNVSTDLRSGTFEASSNTFTLTPEQLVALNARELYVNIHTTVFNGGELRGQILPKSDRYLSAVLLGSNKVPSIHTAAHGNVVFELSGNTLTASGSMDDLSDEITNFHIHNAFSGRNGGVVVPLSVTLDTDKLGGILEAENNVFTITETQVESLIGEGYYVNIHSKAVPSGEIRGQIAPMSSTIFRAELTSSQQVPSKNTTANGRIMLNYDGSGNISVSGTFNQLSNALNIPIGGGIHIHAGKAGRNGGVNFVLNPDLADDTKSAVFRPEDNTFSVTPEQLDALFSRGLYVNIHSYNHPSGELRGQLLPLAKSYLGTNLSGLNHLTSFQTPAQGGIQLEISGTRLVVTGGFSGLTGDFAANIAGGSHLHRNDASGNGGIAVVLNATIDADQRGGTYSPAENTFTISEGLRDSLMSGLIYFNIHSTASPSGEVRGQILRDNNAFPADGFSIITPANNANVSVDGSASDPIEVTWEGTTDPNNDLVVYTWQLATDADFTQVLISSNVGTALSFSTTSDVVAALLLAGGVPSGSSLSLYHRVLASDGSVSTSSEAFAVELTRVGEPCNSPDEISGFSTLGEYGNSKYYLSDDVARPADAQAMAASLGGYLVAVNSEGENNFIFNEIDGMVYIGLNDVDTEGELAWTNGDPVTYENFDICSFCNENAAQQDYVMMHSWNGGWSYSHPLSQRRYVMEIPCTNLLLDPSVEDSFVDDISNNALTYTDQQVEFERIVPNPASEFVNAMIVSTMETEVELKVFDSTGRLMKASQAMLAEGVNSIEIDINKFQAGIYFIHISDEKGRVSNLKFIKIN